MTHMLKTQLRGPPMGPLQTAHEPACPGLDYDRDGRSLKGAICSLFRCRWGSSCKSLCSVASAGPPFWFCLKAVVLSLLVSTWASGIVALKQKQPQVQRDCWGPGSARLRREAM